jgi:hypothetical protein
VATSSTRALICFPTINSDRADCESIQFEPCDCSNRRSSPIQTALNVAT